MKTNTTNTPKVRWLLMTAVFILIYLLLTQWGAFKEGFMDGYRHQTETKH